MRILGVAILFAISIFGSVSALAITPPGGGCFPGMSCGGTSEPPTTPSSASVPSTDTDGSFTFSWGASTGWRGVINGIPSGRYHIEESKNSASYVSLGSVQAANTSMALSGKSNGSYRYRVKACDTYNDIDLCSGWKTSNTIQVRKPPSTPSAPSNINSTSSSFTVGWSKPSGTVTFYSVQEKVGSGSWTTISSSQTGTSISLSGKSNDSAYYYRVRACNTYSWSCSSYSSQNTVKVELKPSTPSKPNDINSTATSYTVSWSKPSGSVSFYQVQERIAGGSWSTITSNHSSTSIGRSGKSNGTNYEYRIAACNSYTWACSGYSIANSVKVRVKPTIPAAPSRPSTSTGSAAISWTKPSGTVTYYDLQKRNNNGSWVTAKAGDTNTSETISGLTDGVWDFRVRACNGYSWACSGYSAASSDTTVRVKPSTPAAPSRPSTSTGSAAISWTKPSGTVTYYDLQKRNNNGSWVTAKAGDTNTSETISGLTDGTWDFRVSACNQHSWSCSSYSAVSSDTIVRLKPGTPSSQSAPSNSNGSANITWNASSGTVTYYDIEKRLNNTGSWTQGKYGVSGTDGTVNGLSDGIWDFRVRACNEFPWACSSYTAATNDTTVRLKPSTPTKPSVPSTDLDGTYTVSWVKPSGTVTVYDVLEYKNGSSSYTVVANDTTALSLNLSGKADASYTYRVRACNQYSWACSSYSSHSNATQVLRVPGAPSSITVPENDADGNFSISWSAVSGTVEDYEVEEEFFAEWSRIATTTATAKSLSNKTIGNYRYRVRACNASGCSAWVTSNTVIIRIKPSTPSAPAVPSTNQGDVEINWTKPTGIVSHYKVEGRVDNGGWGPINNNVSGLVYTATNLSAGAWQFRVSACHQYDWACSNFSAASAVSNHIVKPGQPSSPTLPITSEDGNYLITWTKPSGTVTHFDLAERVNSSGDFTVVANDINAYQFQVTGKSDGIYEYKVRACNQEDWACSEYSQISQIIVNIGGSVTDPGENDPYIPQGTEVVGESKGNATVSGSAAVYSLPIDVPPGRQGMQPALSLNYASNSNSREAGYGWSLSAGSQIHRCEKTFAQDDVMKSFEFSDNDALCLNNERLVLTKNQQGKADSEYRTERESFVKVIARSSGTSRYFEVIEQSGKVTYFGNTNDSKVKYGGQSLPVAWAINRIEDLHGNYVDYKYSSDATIGEHLLSSIEYTGSATTTANRKVAIEWEDDIVSGMVYASGAKKTRTQRIKSIKTYVNTDELVKEYNLFYISAAQSGVSMLKHIQECATDTLGNQECLNPTTFDWGAENVSSHLESSTFLELSGTQMVGGFLIKAQDVDGDGYNDRVKNSYAYYDGPGTIYIESGNPNKADKGYFVQNNYGRHQLFNFNGNGIPDFLGNKKSTEYITDHSYKIRPLVELTIATYNKDNDIYEETETGIKAISGLSVLPLDVNGDGLDDLLVPTGFTTNPAVNAELKIELFINTATGFVAQGEVNEFEMFWNKYGAMDINRDGNADLVKRSEVDVLKVLVSNGTNFEDISSTMPNCVYSFLQDINADGGLDLFCGTKLYWNTGNTNNLFVDSNITLPRSFGGSIAVDFDKDGRVEFYSPGELIHEYIETNTVEQCYEDIPGDVVLSEEEQRQRDLYFSQFNVNVDPFVELIEYLKSVTSPSQADANDIEHGADLFRCRMYRPERLNVYKWKKYWFDPKSYSFKSEYTDIESNLNLQISDSDLDGDLDIVAQGEAPANVDYPLWGEHSVYENKIPNHFDKLFKATSPLGLETYYSYMKLNDADANIYQVSQTPTYPEPHIQRDSIVVHAMTKSDGLGGTLSTRFKYEDGRQNFHGRGFLGFAKIIATEVEANKRTETEFEQGFPINSKVKSVRIYRDSDDFLLTETINQFRWYGPIDSKFRSEVAALRKGDGILDNKTYLPFIESTVTRTYEPNDNSLISEIATNINLNALGAIDDKTTVFTDAQFVTKSTVEDSYYHPADITNWWLHKLQRIDVTNSLTYIQSPQPEGVLNSARTHRTDLAWTDRRQLRSTKVFGDGADFITTKNYYDYDNATTYCSNQGDFGNATRTETSGSNIETRSSEACFELSGYFPSESFNELGHSASIVVEPAYGNTISSTNIDGVLTTSTYDAFGRILTEQVGSQATSSHQLIWCTGCDLVSGAVYKQVLSQPGVNPTTTIYFDIKQRTIKTKSFNFLTEVHEDTQYDNLGRLISTSMPYEPGQTIYNTTYTGYDILNRPSIKSMPNGRLSPLNIYYSYNGLRTDVQVGEDAAFTVQRYKNALGQWWKVVDQGSESSYGYGSALTTHFRYDADGNPVLIQRTKPSTGEVIKNTATYNLLGYKTAMSDPDRGDWTFDYDVIGQLMLQTDANGDKVEFDYDLIGRTKTRFENDVKRASWMYDTEQNCSGNGQATGKPTQSTKWLNGSTKEVERNYCYNANGLIEKEKVSLMPTGESSKSFITTNYYDDNWRLKETIYPGSRVHLQYFYGTNGVLKKVKELNSDTVIQELFELDQFGNAVDVTYGNGLTSKRVFDAQTGRATSICTGSSSCTVSASDTVQGITYDEYDVYGNLLSQRNHLKNVTERFTYDRRQRLVQSQRIGSTTITDTFRYDELGNLVNKSDYSTTSGGSAPAMRYGVDAGSGYQPHQVGEVTLQDNVIRSFDYDANGNLTRAFDDGAEVKSIVYNLQNVPTNVTKGNASVEYFYDVDNSRYFERKESANDVIKTYKLGKLLEITSSNTAHEEVYYVGDYAQYKFDVVSNSGNWNYFHTDRLGSVDTVTDESGNVIQRRGFDSFGKVRDEDWMSDNTLSGSHETAGLYSDVSTRGYTGHDHYDEVGIIHMNGRAYDPELGRFLSVDPFIQFPTNSQSLNPYSYIMNNPIMGTDPTGYLSVWGGVDFGFIPGGELNGFMQFDNAESKEPKDSEEKDKDKKLEERVKKQVKKQCKGAVACVVKRDEKTGDVEVFAIHDKSKSKENIDPESLEGFVDFLLNHANKEIAAQGGWRAKVWGFFASDAIDSVNELKDGNYSGAAEKIIYTVVKPAKFLKKAKDAIKKTCCFVAGTLILTDQGHKNIEDLKLGDLVWSKNTDTGEQAYKPITEIFIKDDRVIYELIVIDQHGEEIEIETTDDHPFFVIGKGFLSTIELTVGDLIETDGHGPVVVKSVINENRTEVTYNFTAADFHTYYVTEKNILVHNEDACDVIKRGWSSISEPKNLEKNFEKAFGKGSLKQLDSIKEQLASGKSGGTIHNLGKSGGTDLTGWKAIDVAGTGKGRGQGRVIFRETDKGIEIRGIVKGHDYKNIVED